MKITNLKIKVRNEQMIKLNEVYRIDIGSSPYDKFDPFGKEEQRQQIVVYSKNGFFNFDLEDALGIEFKIVREDLITEVGSSLEEVERSIPKYEESKNNSR